MKKSLLIMVMFTSMVLAACGDDDDKNNGTNNQSTSNNATTKNNKTTPNNKTTDPNNKTTTNNATSSNNNTTNQTTNGTTNQACVESTVAGPCDALCQTGCIDTQACIAGAFGEGQPVEEICQPVGPGAQGVACGQGALCLEGFGCLGGTCLKYCRLPDGAPACGVGESCFPLTENGNIGVCQKPEARCTVFPDSCGPTETCVNTQAGSRCIPSGPKMKGEACGGTPDTLCAKGLGCTGPDANSLTCRTYCAVAGDCSAAANEVCSLLQNQTYGVCTTP